VIERGLGFPQLVVPNRSADERQLSMSNGNGSQDEVQEETMHTYGPCSRLAALVAATLLSGTPVMAQSTSISTEYLMTVYLP
jgi:hypothetical protein